MDGRPEKRPHPALSKPAPAVYHAPPTMEQVMSETRTESRSAAVEPHPGPAPHAPPPRESRFAGRRVHFIGIGGSGMNGLARMLLDSGAAVSGSDPNPNAQTLELAGRGARVSRSQMGELLA